MERRGGFVRLPCRSHLGVSKQKQGSAEKALWSPTSNMGSRQTLTFHQHNSILTRQSDETTRSMGKLQADSESCTSCKNRKKHGWFQPAKLVGGGGGTSSILGWVPKSYMVEWDRRVAFGPAFSRRINNQFPNDKSIPLFETRPDADHYFTRGEAKNTRGSINILPPNGEQIPVVPAFPFIGKSSVDSNDPIRELLIVEGSSMNVDEDEIDTRIRVQNLRNKLQNIHVYFIVDATASMKRYYPELPMLSISLTHGPIPGIPALM